MDTILSNEQGTKTSLLTHCVQAFLVSSRLELPSEEVRTVCIYCSPSVCA